MSIAAKLRRAPVRIATGAFILNSGLGKLRGDEETAKHVHSAAAGAYPAVGNVEPKIFLKALGAGETALGGALLLPLVPARLAGAGLTGFAAALLGLYWRTPGMHQPGDPRPTQQGTAIAKDSWMLGIGTSLLVDSIVSKASESHLERKADRRVSRAERKAQARARKDELKAASTERRKQLQAEAKQRAKALRVEAKARAKAQAKAARKSAEQVAAPVRSAMDSARSAAEAASETVAGKTRSLAESAADKIGS